MKVCVKSESISRIESNGDATKFIQADWFLFIKLHFTANIFPVFQ